VKQLLGIYDSYTENKLPNMKNQKSKIISIESEEERNRQKNVVKIGSRGNHLMPKFPLQPIYY
jgi:hypothetical protein